MPANNVIDARERFRGDIPAKSAAAWTNMAACERRLDFLDLVTKRIPGDHVAHAVALALCLHMDPETGIFDMTPRDVSHFCGLNPYAVERAWERMLEKGAIRLEGSA